MDRYRCAHFNVPRFDAFSCGPLTIRPTVRTQRRAGKTKANSTKNLFSQHSERQRWRFYSSSFILTSPSFMCVFGFESVKERLCLCTCVCLGGKQQLFVFNVLIVDWRMQCRLLAWCVLMHVLMGCQSPSSHHRLCCRCICVCVCERESMNPFLSLLGEHLVMGFLWLRLNSSFS